MNWFQKTKLMMKVDYTLKRDFSTHGIAGLQAVCLWRARQPGHAYVHWHG